MHRPPSILLALLALISTLSTSAFTPLASTLSGSAQCATRSSTSLAVLRDLRSTRTQNPQADDDDDHEDDMRNNIRQTLSFAELLQKSHTTTAASSSIKKQTHSRFVAETNLPTDLGLFRMRGYALKPAHPVLEPCVIYAADKPPFGQDAVPVRIHDQCLTSEVFGSLRYVSKIVGGGRYTWSRRSSDIGASHMTQIFVLSCALLLQLRLQ